MGRVFGAIRRIDLGGIPESDFWMRLPLYFFALILVAVGYSQNNRPPLPAPTHANVPYGDHPNQVIDFWKADIGARGPLAIYIHGGGFTGGSKDKINPSTVTKLLNAGIHVAAVEYRFIKHAKLPAAHEDVKRALQFVRSKSRDWAINPKLIGAFGGSAGAQLSGYLAFHDDMADPDSEDPIARQSTRLFCVALSGAQSTMDLNWWVGNIPGYEEFHATAEKYWGLSGKALEDAIREASIINHITPDDPPVYMSYGMAPDARIPEDPKRVRGWMIHHVNFGIAMLQKFRAAGVEATLDYPGPETRYGSAAEFLIDKLAWKNQRSLYEDYEPGVFSKGGDEIAYQLLRPRNFDPQRTYPLVLFLHGSGGRGPANIRNLTDADVPARLATDAVSGSYEAFYLVPQCPGPNTWADADWMASRGNSRPSKQAVLLELVDHLVESEAIDPSRLYVTGLSMGGFGTFSVVAARPDFWAAAAPVCGGWQVKDAKLFVNTPMWLFHGDEDLAVSVQYSRDMDQAIRSAGGNVQYTEYPGLGHNSWLTAYWEDRLWEWMFEQRR